MPARSAVCGLRRLAGALFLALALGLAQAGAATAQQVGLIRDAEIEAMIRDFATPLLRAAGIQRDPPVNIVSDRRFNAFVTEDGAIYVNYGTILDAPSPAALKAVLAHEIGHLAGGHVARLRQQMEVRGQLQAVSMLLGIGAVAAASGSGNAGQVSQMASAFILATQSAGTNTLMAYRRSEESAADAAALRLLEATGQTARGMVEVLEILSRNQLASSVSSPYLSTHPMAQDRLSQVRANAQASRYWSSGDPATDIRQLDLVKAKISGFLEGTGTVSNRYPNSDGSLAARYARTIAAYNAGSGASAINVMPSLIAEAPSNPYLRELYGQMLYELGNPGAAIDPLRQAVNMAPDETQIRILYGQALLGAGGGANLNEAVLQLKRAAVSEPANARIHTLLSRAHGGLGQQGEATLEASEAALARGEYGTAFGLAREARNQLPQETPAWLRANDILALNR